MSDSEFEIKANAASHIDELVQVSKKSGNTKADHGGRHGEMASGGWEYRTAYFEDFDGKYYRLTISAAKNRNGSMVYNVGQIKEEAHPKIKGSDADNGNGADISNGPRGFASSNTSISDAGEKSNSKFSMKTDSQGRELSEAQQAFFKDSKVRDSDGRLMTLYHQTENEFTVFDPRHQGAGTQDDGTPFGIFLKSSDRDIGMRASPPARGAWIEISNRRWKGYQEGVAPRTGGVD